MGPGAALQEDGVIAAYIQSELTNHDARLRNQRLGTSHGQQAWEPFMVLVSLRAWMPRWQKKRVRVHIKADNMAALAAASALKGKRGVGLILRELSLMYSS